jgi:opacity protein-like surface antigen
MKSTIFGKAAIYSLLLASLSVVQAAEISQDDKFTANLSGYLGQKSLDDNDWGTQDGQDASGVTFDFKKQSWPVSIVVGLVASGDVEENGALKTEAYTIENRIGVRKYFESETSSFSPYIGGGLALVSAGIRNKNGDVITSKNDDDATGAWVGAGLNYAVSDHFIVGFDVTYTEAEVTLFNVDRKAGGMHSGITAGYHW